MIPLNNEPAVHGPPISRQAVRDALAVLGLQASHSCLLELIAEPWGITVTTYFTDAQDMRQPDPEDASRAWTVRTYHPIED